MKKRKTEDLIRFTVKCKKLKKKRNNSVINTGILDPEERMKDLLFRNKDFRSTSRIIRDLWTLRGQLLKGLENRLQKGNQEVPRNNKAEETSSPQSDPPQCGPPQSRKTKLPPSCPPQCGLPQCRRYQSQSNPPQCGLPLSRLGDISQNNLLPSRIKNPPQSGPPQCGLPPSR